MQVPGYDSRPVIDNIPGVRVRALDDDKGQKKERFVVMDRRMPTPGIVYTHNNSLDNVLRGIGERLKMVSDGRGGFCFPPRPRVFDLEEYRSRLLRKMPKFDAPITLDEFVQLYDGPKRKRYESAVEQLVRDGLQPSDGDIALFIKDEKICSWSKVDPAPRLISPRSPKYCVQLGRYIKPIEHLLYKAVARVWGETTIAKGLNFNERGVLIQQKWESFNDPVAVGLDASRFDQHVSELALMWEHSVYMRCYPREECDGKLARLLERQLVNRGRCYVENHLVEYEHRGGRMSGDMNTALGNCLIMTGLVWEHARQLGVTVKLINDGDDCVVFMERADLARYLDGLEEWFRARGFTMKVEKPAFELEQIEFCQCRPVWNGEQYTMCRNVFKALFTDGVHVGRTLSEIQHIRSATSKCGKVWSKGLPIFGEFYEFLSCEAPRGKSNFYGDYRHSGTVWQAKGCVSGTTHITDEARASFHRAFGITGSEQVLVEDFYKDLPKTTYDTPQDALVYNPQISPDSYPLFVSESLCEIVFNK